MNFTAKFSTLLDKANTVKVDDDTITTVDAFYAPDVIRLSKGGEGLEFDWYFRDQNVEVDAFGKFEVVTFGGDDDDDDAVCCTVQLLMHRPITEFDLHT